MAPVLNKTRAPHELGAKRQVVEGCRERACLRNSRARERETVFPSFGGPVENRRRLLKEKTAARSSCGLSKNFVIIHKVKRINQRPISARTSRAVSCIERAWAMIGQLEPCLPPAVVIILPSRTRPTKLGHFAACAWRPSGEDGWHELAINPVLFERSEDLLETILHEAAHGLLYEWGLKGGCGPDGYYHREEFSKVCTKLGLRCTFNNKRYGWNTTSWPTTGVPERYRDVLALLRQELPKDLRSGKGSSNLLSG